MTLKDANVLLIGGASGIGFAVAEAAAAEGAKVVLASTNAARLKDAAAKLGTAARAVELNVTDEAAVAAFFAKGERFDHIVFTAGDWGSGGLRARPLADLDLAEAAERMRVRFWGALAVAKHGAKHIAPGGSLTLTNGTIAHRPMKNMAFSTATAGALEHLTRGLAVDLAPVRVNCVCPGLVRTGAWDGIPEDRREGAFQVMTKGQIIKRPGEPREVADAYVFLMKSTYTTGQVVCVEGGSLLGEQA